MTSRPAAAERPRAEAPERRAQIDAARLEQRPGRAVAGVDRPLDLVAFV